jgi:hypothetical protein
VEGKAKDEQRNAVPHNKTAQLQHPLIADPKTLLKLIPTLKKAMLGA